MFLAEYSIVLVAFVDDKVVHLNSFREDYVNNNPINTHPNTEIILSYNTRQLDGEGFRSFYNKMKGEAFKDDQLDFLRSGVTNKYFTCRQCLQLISIFTWDEDKLRALVILSPHIIDGENADIIIDSFPIFDEEKARDILKSNRKYKK
jgi:hypothetical protein